MSDEAAGKLKAQELHRLLDLLREYLDSGKPAIMLRRGEPDSCGNPVHLDGQALLAGFVNYLRSKDLPAEPLLEHLGLIMELSTYVRNGGTRALAYRLETGYVHLTPDYFDVLAMELCYEIKDGQFQKTRQATQAFLSQRLTEIDPADELCVSSSIAEIDEILIALARKIEEKTLLTLDSLDNKVSSSNSSDDAEKVSVKEAPIEKATVEEAPAEKAPEEKTPEKNTPVQLAEEGENI